MTRERDILISLTPCPECGGTRWQRWRFMGELQRVWTRGMTARADWPAAVASVLDFGTCFDRCARCGLVIR